MAKEAEWSVLIPFRLIGIADEAALVFVLGIVLLRGRLLGRLRSA